MSELVDPLGEREDENRMVYGYVWVDPSGRSHYYATLLEKRTAHLLYLLRLHNISEIEKVVDILRHDVDNLCLSQKKFVPARRLEKPY